jgi:hypothetical protein
VVVSAYVIEVSAPVGCGPTEALEIYYWPQWMSLGYVCLIERHPKTCSSGRILSIYLYLVCESKVARKPWDSISCRAVCETRTREVPALIFLVLLVL